VFILKEVKVICFDTLLEVLILNEIARSGWWTAEERFRALGVHPPGVMGSVKDAHESKGVAGASV
jgi:hypothetical protein